MRAIGRVLAFLALHSALFAAGDASGWNVYQPKEPACLKRLIK